MAPSSHDVDGVVTCTSCGTESPLSTVLKSGKCPDCDEAIDPDAPARIRRELVDDAGWDKLHGDDYEPIGGVDDRRPMTDGGCSGADDIDSIKEGSA